MRRFLTKFTVLSTVFMMLCVTVFAQNEEKTKNVTNESYPARLAAHIVKLDPSDSWSCPITLMEGYDRPYIVYNGRKYYAGEKIEGILFTAEISEDGNSFEITAKDYDKTQTYEDMYVHALHESMLFGLNRETTRDSGFSFRIEVYK